MFVQIDPAACSPSVRITHADKDFEIDIPTERMAKLMLGVLCQNVVLLSVSVVTTLGAVPKLAQGH